MCILMYPPFCLPCPCPQSLTGRRSSDLGQVLPVGFRWGFLARDVPLFSFPFLESVCRRRKLLFARLFGKIVTFCTPCFVVLPLG